LGEEVQIVRGRPDLGDLPDLDPVERELLRADDPAGGRHAERGVAVGPVSAKWAAIQSPSTSRWLRSHR